MYKMIKILQILKEGRINDQHKVEQLYFLSQRSLFALIGFTLFVSYFLYPSLGQKIVIWGSSIVGLSLFRLLAGYYFRKEHQRFSCRKWYRIFLTLNLLTAILLSFLGTLCIYQVNELERLFIIASLLGLSAGAMSSLFPDIRITLAYVSVIIIPLIFSLFMLGGEQNIILGMMLIFYYVTQVIIAFNVHRQGVVLEKKQKEIIDTQTQVLKNRETLEHFYFQAPIGIFSYDLNLKITECNSMFLEMFHIQKEEIIGQDLTHLPDKGPLKIFERALTEGVQNYVGPYLSTKGLRYWVEAKIFPVHDEKHKVVGGVVLIENKTTEHQATERLRYLASHDALTDLSNRRGFRTFMEQLIKDNKHQTHYSLLFYLDLNRFKYINDSLGHTFGDKLLHGVAARLKSLAIEEGNMTRLGGDEFVIVIPFVAQKAEEAKEKATMYANKIHVLFEEAFIIDDVRLYIKTSIGIVIIEPKFDNVEEIVRHADISMYQAKREGKETISFYSNKLDRERKDTFALQQDIIDALKHDRFELYLQPILHINDDTISAAEALIRWNHPQKGLLQPLDFIPLAIELDIITEIGWWVLKKVCQTIEKWKDEGVWNLEYISINLNAKQLIQNDFIERFFDELGKHHVDTKDIKVEITETSLIDNFELTQQVIRELQGRGITCVIDDFGTGYSSLSYLKKLSFSVLKIDKEFISGLEHNKDNETLVRTIVEIAKQFKYNIVVEGIETAEQKEIIKSIDQQLSYQGFLNSEPVPLEDFQKKFIQVEDNE